MNFKFINSSQKKKKIINIVCVCVCVCVCVFALWYINIRGLFNAEAIFLEEQ